MTLVSEHPASVATTVDTLTRLQDQFLVDRVPVKQLFVDASYARGMTARRRAVLKAKSYDEQRAGVLYVSLRNDTGLCALIDGQGRALLAETNGVETVPCRVYLDLTRQEEAALFLAFNRDRSATVALDDFRARIEAKDPVALDIDRVVSSISLGLRIDRGTHNRTIQAVAALEAVYKQWGAASLRYTLQLIVDTYQGERASLTSEMILGFSAFLSRVPIMEESSGRKMQRDQLIERLRALDGAGPLKGKARLQAQVRPGMGPGNALGRAILAVYDKGRPDHLSLGGREGQRWPEYVISPEESAKRSQRGAEVGKKRGGAQRPRKAA